MFSSFATKDMKQKQVDTEQAVTESMGALVFSKDFSFSDSQLKESECMCQIETVKTKMRLEKIPTADRPNRESHKFKGNEGFKENQPSALVFKSTSDLLNSDHHLCSNVYFNNFCRRSSGLRAPLVPKVKKYLDNHRHASLALQHREQIYSLIGSNIGNTNNKNAKQLTKDLLSELTTKSTINTSKNPTYLPEISLLNATSIYKWNYRDLLIRPKTAKI
jgi:hypothetical protein